jgi:hypothetical protein
MVTAQNDGLVATRLAATARSHDAERRTIPTEAVERKVQRGRAPAAAAGAGAGV